MKEIKNYNPMLSIKLNDLKMLLHLSEEGKIRVLDSVIISAETNEFHSTLRPGDEDIDDVEYISQNIISTISNSVKSYDEFLINTLGYTEEDIDEFHKSRTPQQLFLTFIERQKDKLIKIQDNNLCGADPEEGRIKMNNNTNKKKQR